MNNSINGIKKSAILLMLIGTENAVLILKKIKISEINRLVEYMINFDCISNTEIDLVLKECADFFSPVVLNIQNNYHDYIFSILHQVFGEEVANNLIEDVIDEMKIRSGIDQFNNIDCIQLFSLICNEHIQVVTAIMMHMQERQLVKLLTFFSEKQRSEIIFRMVQFSGLKKRGKKELLKIINDILNNCRISLHNLMGTKKIVDIIDLMHIEDKKTLINNLSKFDTDITENILDKIFLFENIIDIDDKYIFSLLQEIDLNKICIALRNTNKTLQDKFIKNIEKKHVNYLRQELLKNTNVSDMEIKKARKHIVKIIIHLLKNGIIFMREGKSNHV
ncbi:FliG C-terminal domain-containing protein [Buchnera aphidicola (Formosaphis micheliae)]|uniref:FliG C-terminal domain-containing protein n=1 Tax=Buchnera aphidicola TaxID=9 RepID=UPI0031B84ECF